MKFGILVSLLIIQFDSMNLTKIRDVDFKFWSDEKYYVITSKIVNFKDDIIFNVTFNQTADLLLREKARLTVLVADGANPNDYNRVLAECNLDFCKATTILKTSIIVRSLFSKILDCFELDKFKCPYKKGPLYLRNCKVSTINVPDVWPTDVKFKIVIKASGKLPSNKWVLIWTTEIFGTHKGTLT